jgi:HK97 family phage portal protein
MNGKIESDFETVTYPKNLDAYMCHAWVNIAVNILTRNIARAKFAVQKNGEDVTTGRLYDLFRRPNAVMAGFDLWKETAAWWCLEGEAFWWFGADYSGGIPNEIYVLDPRKMRREAERRVTPCHGISNACRWFYDTEAGSVPILPDELVHFRDWNPWNAARGVNPLVSLALELEQDYYANKANTELLKHNAIPHGILKTDQAVRPEEADALERRWESKFGAAKANRKIAVLGKGTSFEAMSFTPEVVKLFELKRWNLYTVLARYGIPPWVAGKNDLRFFGWVFCAWRKLRHMVIPWSFAQQNSQAIREADSRTRRSSIRLSGSIRSRLC